jgi:DNA helicase II / ATP-dependent DNA helicase PcrA
MTGPLPNGGVLAGLTEVQKQAASWDDGPLMLLAGPGSGKTRVLTARIARLFKREPEAKWRVLALTFTTRAADEMRGRIEQLTPESAGRLFAGTFHSFACEVLRQSGSHVGVRTDFKIYSSQADRLILLSDALTDAKVDLGEPIEKAFAVLDGLRDRLAGPESCLRFFANPDRGKRFAAAYTAYARFLQKENALDFPAIIYMAYRLFTEFPMIAERYRRTYRYTSLDEFQDTNLAQYSFVRSFTGDEYKNLFIVADDDQIIYQWNGASPQRLQQFTTDYGPAVLQMPTNFRCPSEVVSMANRLVANNRLRAPGKQPLEAAKNLPDLADRLRVLRFETDIEEAAGVADDIARTREGQLNDVAVIARTKAILQNVQKELSQRGIASQIAQRRDTFASIPYQWLHCSLRVANRRSDQREFVAFVEAGNALWDLQLDAEKLITLALAGNGDLLRSWTNAAASCELPSSLAARVIGSLRTSLAERVEFHKYLRTASTAFSASEAALSETHASLDEDASAWRDLYREINTVLGRNASLDTFLQELDLRSKEPPLDDGVVPLLTIHGSKGNEFKHVYLLGTAEDVLPSFQSKKQGDHTLRWKRSAVIALLR